MEVSFISDGERAVWRTVRAQGRILSVLAIIVVPALLGVWLELAEPGRVGATLYWLVLGALILVQVILFIAIAQGNDTLPVVQAEKRELEEEHELLTETLSDLARDRMWLHAARELGQVWSTGQGLFTRFDLASRAEVRDLCAVVTEPMLTVANVLFDFEYDELWSVAVYEFDEALGLLVPLWMRRAESHPSQGPGREWRPGEGHVGQAFMSQRVLFTTDAGSDEMLAHITPSGPNLRDYDRDVYRSYVSAPVTLGEGEHAMRLGVFVLTSDVIGRFDEENQAVVEHAAQVLAHLLGLHRLAAAAAKA